MTAPGDEPLAVLADRLVTDAELVGDLLDDPDAWIAAHGLSDDERARLVEAVTQRAGGLDPRHRRPALAAAFTLVRHRADDHPASDPSSSTSSSRDDTPSLR
jgi:hypothetical protein